MNAPTSPPTARVPGFDFLRAWARVVIIYSHFNQSWEFKQPKYLGFAFANLEVLFVLSGYLVGRQILRPLASGKSPAIGRFFLKRITRTWPSYFVIIAVYYLAYDAAHRAQFPPLWKLLTFTQNFNMRNVIDLNATWSLCLEEQFYLVIPFAGIFVFKYFRKWGFFWGALVILISGMLLRAWFLHLALASNDIIGSYVSTVYYAPWSRLDGLTLGVSIAVMQSFWPDLFEKSLKWANSLFWAGIVTCLAGIYLLMGHGTYSMAVFGFPLAAFGASLLMISTLAPNGPLNRIHVPGFQHISRISYSIYLVCPIVFYVSNKFLINQGVNSPFLTFVFCYLMLFLFSEILYLSVEKPGLDWRERVLNKKKAVT